MRYPISWGMVAAVLWWANLSYALPPSLSNAATTTVTWQSSVQWGWTLPLAAQRQWAELGLTQDDLAKQTWLTTPPSLTHWLGVAPNTVLDAHRAKVAEFFQHQRWQTRQHWLEVVWKREVARLQAEQALAANAAVTLARAQHEAGNTSSLQYLPYEVTAQETRQAAALAQYEAERAQRAWHVWLGVEQGFPVGHWPSLPKSLPEYAQVLAQAQQYRQDWLQQQQAAAQSTDMAAGQRPALQLPILAQGLTRRPVVLNEAKLELAQRRQEITQEIWEHWHGAQLALQTAQAQREQMLRNEHALMKETFKHYNGMLKDSYDLLRQKQAVLSREQAMYEAQYQFWQHIVALEYAIRSDLNLVEATQ